MTITPTIVCAWCSIVIAPGTHGHGVSHGCCDPCSTRMHADMDAREGGTYHPWGSCPCTGCATVREDFERRHVPEADPLTDATLRALNARVVRRLAGVGG
jgi:hypothetical protein